jgi:hypothetical protein
MHALNNILGQATNTATVTKADFRAAAAELQRFFPDVQPSEWGDSHSGWWCVDVVVQVANTLGLQMDRMTPNDLSGERYYFGVC